MEFLVKVLPEILDLDFPASLEIHHAHRMGPVHKSAAPDQPPLAKTIGAKFLRFQDHNRNRIAEAARKMGNVTWNGHHIMVFADYSKLFTEMRRKSNDCKKMLHERHIKFSLDYPAVLTVRTANGPHRFDDHEKALSFIHTLE